MVQKIFEITFKEINKESIYYEMFEKGVKKIRSWKEICIYQGGYYDKTFKDDKDTELHVEGHSNRKTNSIYLRLFYTHKKIKTILGYFFALSTLISAIIVFYPYFMGHNPNNEDEKTYFIAVSITAILVLSAFIKSLIDIKKGEVVFMNSLFYFLKDNDTFEVKEIKN